MQRMKRAQERRRKLEDGFIYEVDRKTHMMTVYQRVSGELDEGEGKEGEENDSAAEGSEAGSLEVKVGSEMGGNSPTQA